MNRKWLKPPVNTKEEVHKASCSKPSDDNDVTECHRNPKDSKRKWIDWIVLPSPQKRPKSSKTKIPKLRKLPINILGSATKSKVINFKTNTSTLGVSTNNDRLSLSRGKKSSPHIFSKSSKKLFSPEIDNSKTKPCQPKFPPDIFCKHESPLEVSNSPIISRRKLDIHSTPNILPQKSPLLNPNLSPVIGGFNTQRFRKVKRNLEMIELKKVINTAKIQNAATIKTEKFTVKPLPKIEKVVPQKPHPKPIIEEVVSQEPPPKPIIEEFVSQEPPPKPIIEEFSSPEPPPKPIIEDDSSPEKRPYIIESLTQETGRIHEPSTSRMIPNTSSFYSASTSKGSGSAGSLSAFRKRRRFKKNGFAAQAFNVCKQQGNNLAIWKHELYLEKSGRYVITSTDSKKVVKFKITGFKVEFGKRIAMCNSESFKSCCFVLLGAGYEDIQVGCEFKLYPPYDVKDIPRDNGEKVLFFINAWRIKVLRV